MLLSRRAFALSAGGCLLAGAVPALAAAYVDIPVRERDAAAAINSVRASNGRAPLRPNSTLENAAAYQARLMADLDEISHQLAGQSFARRIRRSGYPGIAGENLSAGRTALPAVIQGWMNSPGHRRNMLDPRYSEFGLAAAQVAPGRPSRYRTYWALIVGAPTGGVRGGGGNGLTITFGRTFLLNLGS